MARTIFITLLHTVVVFFTTMLDGGGVNHWLVARTIFIILLHTVVVFSTTMLDGGGGPIG